MGRQSSPKLWAEAHARKLVFGFLSHRAAYESNETRSPDYRNMACATECRCASLPPPLRTHAVFVCVCVCVCVCESQTCSPASTASVRMFLEPGPLVTTGGLVFFHGAKYIHVFFASLPPQIVAVIHIVASQSYFLRAFRRSLQPDTK